MYFILRRLHGCEMTDHTVREEKNGLSWHIRCLKINTQALQSGSTFFMISVKAISHHQKTFTP
jgi:hypothetical protein